ncbi:MAG: hypothetical protein FWF22_00365, partial [Treponema sp.]|nr:hypothetical protein [Treponema sp.]
MKKFCTAAIFFIFTLNFISPMEWPVANGVVSKNFGYNDDGLPILGVNFRASGSVNAADDGDLLFYGDVSGDASGLPPVLGNWLALDHGGGIIGIYSRMAPETTDIPDSTEKSAAIG